MTRLARTLVQLQNKLQKQLERKKYWKRKRTFVVVLMVCSVRIQLYWNCCEWKMVALVAADSGIGLKAVPMNESLKLRALYNSSNNSKVYSEKQAYSILIALVELHSSVEESLSIKNIWKPWRKWGSQKNDASGLWSTSTTISRLLYSMSWRLKISMMTESLALNNRTHPFNNQVHKPRSQELKLLVKSLWIVQLKLATLERIQVLAVCLQTLSELE